MSLPKPPAGPAITDDDATIAAALEDVSIPTLMLSLVHLTGGPVEKFQDNPRHFGWGLALEIS